MIIIWENRCLVCDHIWITRGHADKCPNCNETNEIYSAEAEE